MDPMTVNILLEFLEVAFHNILFLTDVYPKEIFENRKKYGAPVKYSVHPQVNEYIINCLGVIKELFKSGSLQKVVLAIISETQMELQRFVFEVDDIQKSSDEDPYLIKLEQSMRSFCLKLASMKSSLKDTPENSTFSIQMHTIESTAVNLVGNAAMEHFPMIEKEASNKSKTDSIVPIVAINLNDLFVQVYAENWQQYLVEFGDKILSVSDIIYYSL